MTITKTQAPPSLPLGTPDYQRSYQDQLNNVLRLYFNSVNSVLDQILTLLNNGGYFPEITAGTIDAGTVNSDYVNAQTLASNIAILKSLSVQAVQAGSVQSKTIVAGNLTSEECNSSLFTGSGRQINFPFGAFQDQTSQHDGSTTIPYAMRLSQTDYSNGVTIESRNVVSTASIAATTMTVTAITSGRFYPGMILSGTGVTSGTYVYLQLSSTATAVATPTGSGGGGGTYSFTVSSAANMEARQFVSGTGIAANTRITDVSGTTITVDTALTGAVSGTVTVRPWGYEGTYSVNPSQTVSSTTISGVTSSKITVAYPGVYNLQFSAQFTNTSAQIHDVDIWFKKNDVTISASNSQFSVPNQHGGVDGHLIAALNFFVELAAGDYVEIVWHTSNSAVYIETIPAQISPIRPLTPSVIATMAWVSGPTSPLTRVAPVGIVAIGSVGTPTIIIG